MTLLLGRALKMEVAKEDGLVSLPLSPLSGGNTKRGDTDSIGREEDMVVVQVQYQLREQTCVRDRGKQVHRKVAASA